MKKSGLKGFEDVDSLTATGKRCLPWLKDQLFVRHPKGKELPASRLKNWISDIEVRAVVRRLRADHIPIGANGKGYFYAHDPKELDDNIKSLDQRGDACHAAANDLRKAQQRLIQDKIGLTK